MKKEELRIAFLGTPEFAVDSLQMLIDEGYPVVAVFTQPDRPKGRGHKLVAPPVKDLAEENGIPVYQFEKISKEGIETLKEIAPNLLITVAFGQILSRNVLAVPVYGTINVHGSILPKYRGAAPIEMAILNGEKETGITTMYTVYELDAGDILEQDTLEIGEEETGGELRKRMALLGADTLKRTLGKLCDGTLAARPQEEKDATYYPMFPKDFGEIDFSKTPLEVCNFIRALNPSPTAYVLKGENRIKIAKAKPSAKQGGNPGTVLSADPKSGLVIACGTGAVEILELQYPGKKMMPSKDFLRGNSVAFAIGETIDHRS